MKKLFIYLSVAVLGIAAASCQKELAVAEGGKGNVTLTIQTPDAGTKAIADGMNVNIVHYEIYKNEEGHKNSLTGTPLIKGTVPMTAKGASLTLNLLQGQEYVGLFWAQVHGQSYYDVTNLREVKVAYPNEENALTYANDEARAAFCQKKVFSTGKNVSVVLERPFAQINLGTTIADLTDDYTITLEQSSMTVTGVANTFSVADMTAGTTETDVVFSYATVPYVFNPSETLIANNQTWAYAGMNYVLVPGDAATVDVTYSIKTDVGTVTRNVPVVPVKKNYRTNLLGNLLTQETVIEIVVDEHFADSEEKYEGGKYGEINGKIFVKVETAEELAEAVADQNIDMVILTQDVTIESYLNIERDLILDLNGKTVIAAKDGAEVDAIWVRNDAEVVITGNGTINATYDAVFATGTSKVTIENGTFIGVAEAVFAQSHAQVVINGGSFKSTQYPDFTLNLRDKAEDTATITVYGGTFYQFNPENNPADGAGTNYVAEGYHAVETDGVYYVVADDTDAVVTTAAELANVINAATQDITVKFVADLEGNITINQKPGLHFTILGNGKKYTGGIHIFGNGGMNDRWMTIKDINFDGTGLNGDQGCIYTTGAVNGVNSYACNVTIENCTFTGAGVAAIRQNVGGERNWTIKNCTVASDMHSFLQVSNTNESLIVENCKVYSKNGANLNYTAKASFTGCEFDVKGYAVRVGVNGSNSTDTKVFNFTDCTLKSANDDGDAVVIIRQDAEQATLNFVNTTLTGTPQISGNVDGKTTINGL